MPEFIDDDYDFTDTIGAESTSRAQRRQKRFHAWVKCRRSRHCVKSCRLGYALVLFGSVPRWRLATFATPGDPSDEDWSRASEIIARIVGIKLGIQGLRTNALARVASGIEMDAADILRQTTIVGPKPNQYRRAARDAIVSPGKFGSG